MRQKFSNEGHVKQYIKEVCKLRGAWYVMPVMRAGMGRQGIPDFIICYRGVFLAIETKFGRNKPTAHQRRELGEIAKAGGVAQVINEQNREMLAKWFDKIDGEKTCGA